MELKVQKRMAADLLKCSADRVQLDVERLDDIKEAISKSDIRRLISDGAIIKKQLQGSSRVRARKIAVQKAKGRRRGHGSRKGKLNARQSTKETWMIKLRVQRAFLKELKDKALVNNEVYRKMYRRAKGGFFRSKRHIKVYLGDNNLFVKK